MVLQIKYGGGKEKKKHKKINIEKVWLVILIFIISLQFAGCGKESDETGKSVDNLPIETKVEQETVTEQEAVEQREMEIEQFEQEIDASQAETLGGVRVETKLEGYSGNGYLTGFEEEADGCIFLIDIPYDGSYDIVIVSAGLGGEKINDISLDGNVVGSFHTKAEEFEEVTLRRIYMEEGTHEIKVVKNWGWIALDSIRIETSEKVLDEQFCVDSTLINPKATKRTKMLMQYLTDIYGDYILSGQFADNGIYSPEIKAIKKATGDKMPAILGLDFMDYTPSFANNGAVGKSVERAAEYDELGGIVTFCWHWGAPEEYQKENTLWYKSFYAENVDMDLDDVMSGRDEAGYELLLRDMDAIAAQIEILQEADIPILFRPLHEASGEWFWWGASGPESYIALWKLLYERLTEYHGLNNIIWVWNGQSAEWYPGDEYVDIIGEDLYPGKRVYTSQSGKFAEASAYSDSPKIVAMTENGSLFDPDMAFRDKAPWAWFCTWSGEFMIQPGYELLSEEYTETDMVRKVYQHERVITLDELPDLKNYMEE